MESIDKLPWQALKFFYHVARLQRLDAAAECLHVTSGAVSKQIKSLESALGCPVFAKQGRYLVLNAAGAHLYAACKIQYGALSQAMLQIKQQDSDLRVSCEPTLAMKWLIPRLSDFKQRHPQVNVVILAAGGAVDLAAQHIDVAIRRNDFAWPKQVYAEKLADEYMAPVGRADEHQAMRLHSTSRPKAWQTWLAQHVSSDGADQYAVRCHALNLSISTWPYRPLLQVWVRFWHRYTWWQTMCRKRYCKLSKRLQPMAQAIIYWPWLTYLNKKKQHCFYAGCVNKCN